MYNVNGNAMKRIHPFKSKDVEFKHLKIVMSIKTPSKSIWTNKACIKTSSLHTWYVICNNHKNVVTWRNFSMHENSKNMTNAMNKFIYIITRKDVWLYEK